MDEFKIGKLDVDIEVISALPMLDGTEGIHELREAVEDHREKINQIIDFVNWSARSR